MLPHSGHILECIDLIEKYTENKTEEDFLDSVQFQDSVLIGGCICSQFASFLTRRAHMFAH